MAGDQFDAMRAKCPYYRRSGRQCVHCEGFGGGTYLCVSFENVRRKQEYFKALCADVHGWEGCEIAKLVGRQYEEG